MNSISRNFATLAACTSISGLSSSGLSSRLISILVVLSLVLLLPDLPAHAQTESVLYAFTGQPDGAAPNAGLVKDSNGNLYGTTFAGGISGHGTVFKIAATGQETVLYNFTGGADGSGPMGDLLRVSGTLYGSTSAGGTNSFGSVFKLTSAGRESVLANFGSQDGGGYPAGNLIRDASGNLYGTNSGYYGLQGAGAVFKVTPTGVVTMLYQFRGLADGSSPHGLIHDTAGNLYGTTYSGGGFSQGTVFEVTPGGVEAVLYSFHGGDGNEPLAGLLRDSAGNLYGTTTGVNEDYGTVFKVSPLGVGRVLHYFSGTDGWYPSASLIRGTDGALYGTTEGGGSHGYGTVFRITKTGAFTVLYNFTGGLDGGTPVARLLTDKAGNLYGTTSAGGNQSCQGGCGVVFKLSP